MMVISNNMLYSLALCHLIDYCYSTLTDTVEEKPYKSLCIYFVLNLNPSNVWFWWARLNLRLDQNLDLRDNKLPVWRVRLKNMTDQWSQSASCVAHDRRVRSRQQSTRRVRLIGTHPRPRFLIAVARASRARWPSYTRSSPRSSLPAPISSPQTISEYELSVRTLHSTHSRTLRTVHFLKYILYSVQYSYFVDTLAICASCSRLQFPQLNAKQLATLEGLRGIVGRLLERLDYFHRTGLCPVAEGSTSDLTLEGGQYLVGDANASPSASAGVCLRSISVANVIDPEAAAARPSLSSAISDNHMFLRRDVHYLERLVAFDCEGDNDNEEEEAGSSSLCGEESERQHNRSFASVSCTTADATTLSSYPSDVVQLQRSLRGGHHQFSQQKPPRTPPPLLASKSVGHLPSSCDALSALAAPGPSLDDSLPDVLASSRERMVRMHEHEEGGSARDILLPESKYPSDDCTASALRQSETELELLHTADSSCDNTLKHPKLRGCQRGEPNASQFSTIASSGYQSGANAGSPSPPLHAQAAVGSLYSIPFVDDQQHQQQDDSADVTSTSACASPARFGELPEAETEQRSSSPVDGVTFSASPSARRMGRSSTFMVAALSSSPSASFRSARPMGAGSAYENVHVMRAKCPSANALGAASETAAGSDSTSATDELAAPPRPGGARISTAERNSALAPEKDVVVSASATASDARTRAHTCPNQCDAQPVLTAFELSALASSTAEPTLSRLPPSASADRALGRLSESSSGSSYHQHHHQRSADREELSSILKRFALRFEHTLTVQYSSYWSVHSNTLLHLLHR